MKFEVGDEIVVQLTNEEGKIIEIINDKMVMVEVRGVKFPSHTDQLAFPYFKRFTEKSPALQQKKTKKFADTIPKEKAKPIEAKASLGVWLSLIPKFVLDDFGDEVVDYFKVYLVNKTENGYKCIYEQTFAGASAFELSNQVPAFHDFYLHDVSFAGFNDNPSFLFDFSLVTPDKSKEEVYETTLKIKGKQIFNRVEDMKQKNEPTITFLLFETYPEKAITDTQPVSKTVANEYTAYEAKKVVENLEPARSVIDLHMEKLMTDWQKMSNYEILTTQLNEFHKWYDLAVAHKQQDLVVIHGVGSGKLRDEIHEILKTKKEVRYFINQYDHRFGYGATEIFFQY